MTTVFSSEHLSLRIKRKHNGCPNLIYCIQHWKQLTTKCLLFVSVFFEINMLSFWWKWVRTVFMEWILPFQRLGRRLVDYACTFIWIWCNASLWHRFPSSVNFHNIWRFLPFWRIHSKSHTIFTLSALFLYDMIWIKKFMLKLVKDITEISNVEMFQCFQFRALMTLTSCD